MLLLSSPQFLLLQFFPPTGPALKHRKRTKKKTTKDLKAICSPRFATILRSKRISPCVSTTKQKSRTPHVSGPSGSESRAKNLFSPREKGEKKGKNEAKIHGCLIEPQKWQPKMGPFFDKKIIFALCFRMFRENRVKKWGSTKHPATYIYIYI